MKKVIVIILLCLITFSFLIGCENPKVVHKTKSQTTSIGNPWSDWETVDEAEAATGFSFGLPEVVADSYQSVAFRTLNRELIEVIYHDEDLEVRVRKQKGEGQDISGDYNQYDTCTEETFDGGTSSYYCNSGNNAVKQLISYKGYSWSLVAPNGYGDDSNWDFASEVLEH